MSHSSFIEGLESRVFLSAAPALFNTTVRVDRLMVQFELLKFRADLFGSELKLLADTQAIKKNVAAGDTSLVAPFQTLHADVKTMTTTLRSERLTESANALADESTIKLDIRQILKDKGNAAAEATDHAKLLTDRVTLQNDLLAGLNARIATRQSSLNTITADAQGIVTAATNDAAASAALKAAATKFGADRTARLTTLTADLQAIAAARTKLAADLTAEQSM